MMTANKKVVDDCDICKIASPANCKKCDVLGDTNYRWVRKEGFNDIEWDKLPDKAGSQE